MWVPALTSAIKVVRVHEGEGFVAVRALLGVALVHGVHHDRHLLPGAAHRLLPLLGQFPWDREFGYADRHVAGRQSTHSCSGATAFILAMIYVPYVSEVSSQKTSTASASNSKNSSSNNDDKPEKPRVLSVQQTNPK